MVYVLPEFVTPYVKSNPLWPSKTSLTRGKVVFVKKSRCWLDGPNMCENVYRDEGLMVDIRERKLDDAGSDIRTVEFDIGSRYGVVSVSSLVSSPS